MRARPVSCCFSGHRPTKLPWGENEDDPRCRALKVRLRDALDAAYEAGYRHFICGMAQGCDLYFCELALALRQRHGDVSVEAAIPCPTQADGWPRTQQERYRRLVAACDYETLVQSSYSPGCMQRRNRYMVDRSDCVLAFWNGSRSGTGSTVAYALKTGRTVYCFDVHDLSVRVLESAAQQEDGQQTLAGISE